MKLRVSGITVQMILLDEYDSLQEAQPIPFTGDAEGSAIDKLRAWIDELPAKLAEAEKRSAEADKPKQSRKPRPPKKG